MMKSYSRPAEMTRTLETQGQGEVNAAKRPHRCAEPQPILRFDHFPCFYLL